MNAIFVSKLLVLLCHFLTVQSYRLHFLQFHVVDHQSAVLHVQCFHARAMTVQKDEHVTAAYILSHPLSDQSA